MNDAKNSGFIVSFCGIMSALSVVCMFLTSVLPIGVYIFPAIAGMLVWVVSQQLGIKWSIVTFFSVSILSVFLVPDIESKIIFISFMGYYPTVRQYFMIIKLVVFRTFAKLIVFNIAMIIAYSIILKIAGADVIMQDFKDFGKYAYLIFLGMGNVAFVMLDFVMDNLFFAYGKWILPKIRKRFR